MQNQREKFGTDSPIQPHLSKRKPAVSFDSPWGNTSLPFQCWSQLKIDQRKSVYLKYILVACVGKEFPLKVNTSIRKYFKMFGLNYDSNQTLPVLRKALTLFLQRNNSITHPPRKLKVKGVVSIKPIDVHWSVEYLHSVLYQLFLLNFFCLVVKPRNLLEYCKFFW